MLPQLYLYPHGLGLDDVDLVPVAAPHLVVHHTHTADGVVRPTQVQQVVVGQIPLTVSCGNSGNYERQVKEWYFFFKLHVILQKWNFSICIK